LRDGLGLVADCHADATRAMIQGQYSHRPAVLQQTAGVASRFAPLHGGELAFSLLSSVGFSLTGAAGF
jgi:hypothetical protein